MYRLSTYHVVSEPFFIEGEEGSSVILFATRTGAIFKIPRGTWESLTLGDFSLIDAPTLTELRNAEVIVPKGESELDVILSRNRKAIASNRHLNYVIQPTAQCQLGCGYCGQKHSPGGLNEANLLAIVDDVTHRLAMGNFDELNLCWFGAEPLMGIKSIRSLTPALRGAALRASCEYRASMITNGLALTREIARELIDELSLVSITISLDGTAELHNTRRHTKRGRATFERISQNLQRLVEVVGCRDIEVNVRCNVDRENSTGVIPLLHHLSDIGVHRKIRFYVAPIHGWGNDAHLRSLDSADFAALEMKWFCEMARLGFRMSLIPTQQRIVCLAVQPHSALVDVNGNLFNCTEVSYVPAYGEPNEFAIGNVALGEAGDTRSRLGNFNDQVESGAYDCSSCAMLPVCGGACPKEWLEGRKPCPSAKVNIRDRLLLAFALSRQDLSAGGHDVHRDVS